MAIRQLLKIFIKSKTLYSKKTQGSNRLRLNFWPKSRTH